MASSTRHPFRGPFLAFVGGLVFCAGTRAVQFAGGTGEPNDPYQVATIHQLLAIDSSPDLTTKQYVLTASLDMSGTTLSAPVVRRFSGTFDGKGHTIRNLRLEGRGSQGVFATIDREGEVRNLGLAGAHVAGPSSSLAVLAGDNSGRIVNCYSTGAVVGRGASAGGLVACNRGTVIGSHSTVTVTGGANTGGLIGQNMGTVSCCYATGAVTGDWPVGGLVGMNWGVTSSCYATGEVTAATQAGGLVGQNLGAIVSSSFTGTVCGLRTHIGGLVGMNTGRITGCHAQATVVGQDRILGGLAGGNSGDVSQCYAVGSVTGQDTVGGLVGSNSGRIATSYCDTTAVSYGRAGGLVGQNYGGISDSYSTGSVEGEDQVGGLVGDNNNRISTSYSVAAVMGYGWDTGGLVGRSSAGASSLVTDCYFLDWLDGGGPDNGIGTPLTSAQMKQQASFAGWDFWGIAADGVNDAWFMPPDAYPALAWQTDITGLPVVPHLAGLSLRAARVALTAAGFVVGDISYDFSRTVPAGHVLYATPYPLAAAGATIRLVASSGGTYDWTDQPGGGTLAQPYRIVTAGQLESLTDHPELWDKHFVLSADLDMAGRTYTKALIAPDVDDTRSGGFQGTPFRGTFDGRGYAIRNPTIHQDTTRDYVGLFGLIAWGARIDNLTLLDADVIGGSGSSSYVGVLAGYNQGTIANCRATGFVHGGKGDGLVGFNTGSLIDCRSDVIRN